MDASDNVFVTTCEARFTRLERTSNDYVLVWACPQGVEPPSDAREEEVCRTLFESGLVQSCQAPTGTSFVRTPAPDVPPTTR